MLTLPLLWIHLLSLIGAFGALLALQLILPRDLRAQAAVVRRFSQTVNWLVLIGFLAGLLIYIIKDGPALGAHYNGIIGVKFLFLLGVGALNSISRKKVRGDALRWGAILLLAIAAFFGLSLT